MAVIVQKFGGTSVADLDRIRHVARRVVATHAAGNDVVVVVSAMGGETDELVRLARGIAAEPPPREFDVLLATGEQKTIALLAMAIQTLGTPAQSFTGTQLGMRTDDAHTRARILEIDCKSIREQLDRGRVVVVAGFQGSDDAGNITTLGRGGSDTSAVAVAAALGADVCEIYTDVDGICTSDPNIVPNARKLDRISYDEMLEMASLGAAVLQTRSVQFGKRYGVPIHVRSSFNESEGTWVVSGVTYNRNEAEITLFGIPDEPGAAAEVFGPLSDAGVIVDVIVQNVSSKGHTDITFTLQRSDLKRALPIVQKVADQLGAAGVTSDDSIAKVSVVGLGMKDHAGVASRMFRVLSNESINIQMINTSEIKISVIISERYTELACRTLHAEFDLGTAPAREESS